MLIIETNKKNLIVRSLMMPMSVILGYLIIHYASADPKNVHTVAGKIKAVAFLCIIIGAAAYLFIKVAASILGVIKVVADKGTNTITFISFFRKRVTSISDIGNYWELRHKNPGKMWRGLLIHTKDNKTIQLAEQNLQSIVDFKAYLDEKSIPCPGQKSMMFPFD